MANIFKNNVLFTSLYLTGIFILLFLINFIGSRFLIAAIRPIFAILLFLYYYFNANPKNRKITALYFALAFFMIGEMLVSSIDYFFLVLFFFGLGKIAYCFKFSFSNDFSIKKMIPYLVICFFYILILFNTIYDNLNQYVFPLLIYIFISLLLGQLIFISKTVKSQKAFLLAMLGIVLFTISETFIALTVFNNPIRYGGTVIIILYYFAQFFIIRSLAMYSYNPKKYVDIDLSS